MKIKKVILTSLAALLAFSPATAVLADTNINKSLPNLKTDSYTAPKVRLATRAVAKKKPTTTSTTLFGASLAKKYDPRGTKYATPVGNQNYLDLCWSYTATDLMALSLRKSINVKRTFSPNYYNYLIAKNAFTQGKHNPLAQDRTLWQGGDDTWAESAAFLGYTPVSTNVMKTPAYPYGGKRNA
jgi:hypothetical protein